MNTEIVYCQRCQIAYINGVFHWSYGNKPTTPEAVLAKVCIPTEGMGVQKPCLAKLLYETELRLQDKSSVELREFVRSNNNAIDFELPENEVYLKMAREILGDKNNDGQV